MYIYLKSYSNNLKIGVSYKFSVKSWYIECKNLNMNYCWILDINASWNLVQISETISHFKNSINVSYIWCIKPWSKKLKTPETTPTFINGYNNFWYHVEISEKYANKITVMVISNFSVKARINNCKHIQKSNIDFHL